MTSFIKAHVRASKAHVRARPLAALAAGLLVALAAPAQAQTHVDNPFLGASPYVNPDFTAKAEAAAAVTADRQLAALMRVVGSYPTAVWLDRVEAVPSLATHLDRAVAAKNDLALFVLYDMPGRGCDDLVLDGELPLTSDGVATYETQFIDAIAAIAAQPKYAGVRIVFIVEPDSLANLVTSLSTLPCMQAQTSGLYVSAVQYAVNKLHPIPNVYLYLDVAHAGWLGWSTNATAMASFLNTVSSGFTDRKNALDGFSTNVADYVPVKEPFMTATTTVAGQQVSSAKFYQYNANIEDASFAAEMWSRLTAAGWPTTIGMIGDTSRNGWGGARRPIGPSPVLDDLEKFVNETRVDRRTTRSAWCNQSGAGLGERPQAAPAGYEKSHYDAFVWAKTPGVSDGSALQDPWCDPSYLTRENVLTGALPDAPAAGQWFPALFTQLVKNMWPMITGEPPSYTLTVTPNDLGVVTSTPAGIDCGATCSASFVAGTQVTLTAVGIADTRMFQGWTGACAGVTTPTCVVSMVQPQTVGITFDRMYPLVVTLAGAGAGTVTSSPGGIECGSTCDAWYVGSTLVTLTAKPASGSSFTGWSGACRGARPTCTVSMYDVREVTATFQPGTWYPLDVLVGNEVCNPPPGCLPGMACPAVCYGGNGVISSPAGIDCSSTSAACSAAYASGTSVTLTAVPYSNNLFAGWVGACAGSTVRTCVVPMIQAQSVSARFVGPTYYVLHASTAGSGAGKITGWGGAIDCGTICNVSFTSGTTVTLTANAAPGSTFSGWTGGGCSATSLTCAVPMNSDQSVTASFMALSPDYTLTVSLIIGGMGAGAVTSSPAGIACGATCAARFTAGTTVTLTATPAAGSTFAGWSGACAGVTGTTCLVTMGADRSASAAFAAPTSFPLAVTKTGLGTGTVVSTPAGIQCGTACTASFLAGSAVTLSAAAATGSVFAGWGGACTGYTTCVVPMTKAQSVVASFGGPNPIYSVTKSGTGAGTVVSTPAGLSCGSTCTASIPAGVITLTATASPGSTFAGWSGGCTSAAATCVLTADPLTQKASAVATFDLAPSTPCANPITFSWNSGNFDTANAVCYRTSQKVNGWGCSNFAGRTVKVNDGAAAATCGAGPFPLGKASDGYTYFAVSAGQYTWASLYVW